MIQNLKDRVAAVDTTDWPSKSARSLKEALNSYTDVRSVQARVKKSLSTQGSSIASSYIVRPHQAIPDGSPPRHWANKKYQQAHRISDVGQPSMGEEKKMAAKETSTPEGEPTPPLEEPHATEETGAEKDSPAKVTSQKGAAAAEGKKTPAKASSQKGAAAAEGRKTPAKASSQKGAAAAEGRKTPAKASSQHESAGSENAGKEFAAATTRPVPEGGTATGEKVPTTLPSAGEGEVAEETEFQLDIFPSSPVQEEGVEILGGEAATVEGEQTEEAGEGETEELRLLPQLPPLPMHPLPPTDFPSHFLVPQTANPGDSWRPEDRARADSYFERMERLAAQGEAVMKSIGDTSLYFRRESNKTLTEMRKTMKAAQAEKDALTKTRHEYHEAVAKVEGTRARYDEAVAQVELSAQKIVRFVSCRVFHGT